MEGQTETPQASPVTSEDSAASPEVKAGETSQAESAPVEKSEKPEKEDKFSRKFAALSKREKQLLERETQIKEREKKVQPSEALEKELLTNPLKFLQKYGFTMKDLTAMALNDEKPTPELLVRQVEDKLDRLEKQREEEKKAQAEKEQQEAQKRLDAEISAFRKDIGEFIDKNGETYELTKAHPEGADLIYNVIYEHYNRTNRVLTHQEAAEAVEKHLEEEAEKLLALKKLQAKIKPTASENPKPDKIANSSKTLTNAQATEVPAPRDRRLSPEESKQEAAKLLRWT